MKKLFLLLGVILSSLSFSAGIVDPDPFKYLDQEFISSCKADKPRINVPRPITNINYATEIACIAANLSAQDKTDAIFFRYITLTNTFNSETDADIRKLKNAINKTINSVSRNIAIKPVVFIGNPAVIARFDLRDYGLKIADFDVELLKLYPYAVTFFDDAAFAADELFIAKVTRSPQAWVRGDWFVQQVSQPPVYYDFLRLPNSTAALFKLLNIDEAAELQKAEARRAGFRHGGVSNWNRLIDYHEQDISVSTQVRRGDLWRTFDVINQIDFRNFFTFPFGPAGILANDKGQSFIFDASEFIFTLPNGLDGYFLANGQGIRIDEAATAVATDKDNVLPFIGSAPNVVVNGVSCMHCHAGGMNSFRDEIRAYAATTAGFSKKEFDEINFLFGSNEEFSNLRDLHNVTFTASINALAPNSPDVLDQKTEPVFAIARFYADDLSLARAAADLGISVDDFRSCLIHSPSLAAKLGIGDFVIGKIARDAWEAGIAQANADCNIGISIIFKGPKPPPPPPPPPVVVPPPPVPPPKPPVDMKQLILFNDLSRTIKFILASLDGSRKIESSIKPAGEWHTRLLGDCSLEAVLGGESKHYLLKPGNNYQFDSKNGESLVRLPGSDSRKR